MVTALATPAGLRVEPGPGLLAGLEHGPSLLAHRALHGPLPRVSLPELVEAVSGIDLLGRGGAGFPFARKLQLAASSAGRPSVVVNLSEGEPASAKDAALALHRPHLVLDGAVLAARALRARAIHLVVPGEDRRVAAALLRATAERERQDRVRFTMHRADAVFVAGQSQAVIELMSGRPNRPVTSWDPAAARGYRGRPTLLSNAETFAQAALLVHEGVATYVGRGAHHEPGTTLLTVHDRSGARVCEVELGTPWSAVLSDADLDLPVLVGGFHGSWARPGELRSATVSRTGLAELGLTLGAGIVLATDQCPLTFTAAVTDYLAAQSARRCGPCLNGLPALAASVRRVADGIGGTHEVERLCSLVDHRGACAHPDGTVRLVRSLLSRYPDEVARHAEGRCGAPASIGLRRV